MAIGGIGTTGYTVGYETRRMESFLYTLNRSRD